VSGETVIVDLKSKHLYGVDAAGGWVWHALDGERDAAELARQLEAGDNGELARAIESFLAELDSLGLVVTGPCANAASIVAELPGPGESTPRILWREELRAAGLSCAFQLGQSETCDTSPTMAKR
jgi:hypothetical protein